MTLLSKNSTVEKQWERYAIDILLTIVHIVFTVNIRILIVLGLSMGFTLQCQDFFSLPDRISGWELTDRQTHTPETLYEYIDGAAELYISFGFRIMASATYKKQGEPDIQVDWFDMGEAANAFGIFTHGMENPAREVGQGSEYADGQLRFWKGRFFATIQAAPETGASRAAVFKLASLLTAAIAETGTVPGLVSLLPEKKLASGTIRFFSHFIWQNEFYRFSDQNVLGISAANPAIMGLYGEKGRRAVLLLVRYATPLDADRSLQRVSREIAAGPDLPQGIRMSDGTWAAAQTCGLLLMIVLRAVSCESALDLMSEAVKRSEDPPNIK